MQAFDNVTNIFVFDKVIQCIYILKKKGMNTLNVGMQVFYLEDQVSVLWQSEKHILSVMKKRNYLQLNCQLAEEKKERIEKKPSWRNIAGNLPYGT